VGLDVADGYRVGGGGPGDTVTAMGVRICLTARVRVEADGVSAEPGLGRLASLALAYLAVERHRPVPHAELAEVLWGEALPQTWNTSLRGIVSRLRSAFAVVGLARVARAQRDYGGASSLDREAMTLATGLGAKRAIAEWLEGTASTAFSGGDCERAICLLGAAGSVRQAIGALLPPRDVASHEDRLALAREKIGEAAFQHAWDDGRAMELEEAMRYALSEGQD